MAASSPLHDYLDRLRIIHGSAIASDERSYYPALDLRVPAAASVASFAPDE